MSSASVASLPPTIAAHPPANMMQPALSTSKYQHLHFRPSSCIAPSAALKTSLSTSSSSDVSPPIVSQPSNVDLPQPSDSSSASTLSSTSLAPPLKIGGSLVQPKKEWVLPARAKPGRKPSVTEPLTKRKAQNRASQRAFRERKQSYLQELEEKVAAYEAAEIDRSVDLQKLAQKLRAENQALQEDVSSWKDKASQLEDIIKQARFNGYLPPVLPSIRSGPGCKAPSHEKPAVPKRSALVGPSTTSKEKGEVRFADSVSSSGYAVALPIKTKLKNAGPPSTSQSHSPAHKSLLPSSTISKEALLSTDPVGKANQTILPAKIIQEGNQQGSLSPPLMPSHHIPVDGGCGFCTENSPCVCAEDLLDLSGTTTSIEPSSASITGPNLNQTPETSFDTRLPRLEEYSNKMSIKSLAMDKQAQATDSCRPQKLWYTVKVEDSSDELQPLPRKSSRNLPGVQSKMKRLWYTTQAPGSETQASVPMCNGNPSTCGACSTDPGLAAFCKAVTTASSSLPYASKYPRGLDRPRTTSSRQHGYASSPSRCLLTPASPVESSPGTSLRESIPSAWRQIRSHPRFSQWQGGLDLLAEVVSKRSGSVHSPLLSKSMLAQPVREPSVDIEPTRPTQMKTMTSSDRITFPTASKPVQLHADTDINIKNKRDLGYEEDNGEELREQKKRRILVDKESVEEALAMLDSGTIAQPRIERRRNQTHDTISGSQPCPCPWRPEDKHVW